MATSTDLEITAPCAGEESGMASLALTAGDSFEVFYRGEYRAVVGLATVLSGSHSAGEDLAQDAFVAAYRKWRRLVEYENPGAWVRRVVVNRSVSRHRRLLTEARGVLHLQRERREVPSTELGTDEIWTLVRRLPRRQRQVVVLIYLDRRTANDSASILGCSVATVKTHLARAKRALAQELEGETDDVDE